MIIIKKYQKITEILIVYWLQYEKKQDFPTKIDRSLSTYLSSKSVYYIKQASYI